ncbi:hypothetical protein DE146DRAFT_672950 [Phaeosphaeria sp. MPI-PUGE-AT-0046c]|nr:hypothetical protein DE146DRAFT_672950 [Phaeosphaeria sp. MPI-PUGE-AT-0046c]
MIRSSEVSYSESASIAAVADFFKFLTKLYLDEELVEWPPEGGWPSITTDTFASLNKSESVVSFLRQLPYMQDFRVPIGEVRPQGLPEASFWNWKDYRGTTDVHGIKVLTEGFLCERTNPDIVGMVEGGQDDSTVILLDTKHGIAYWADCPDQIRHEKTEEQVHNDYNAWASDQEAGWRGDAPAWTIPDFFAMLRREFEQLRFIPVNTRQVINSWSEYSDDGELEAMLQGIYREHGWPNLENYQKEECLQAVQQALAKQYPDFEL